MCSSVSSQPRPLPNSPLLCFLSTIMSLFCLLTSISSFFSAAQSHPGDSNLRYPLVEGGGGGGDDGVVLKHLTKDPDHSYTLQLYASTSAHTHTKVLLEILQSRKTRLPPSRFHAVRLRSVPTKVKGTRTVLLVTLYEVIFLLNTLLFSE